MADNLSPSRRSRNMAAIKSTGTKPELIIRSLVHRMGYRFRLHAKDIPGKPDLVFRSRNKAVFVHGCFWNQHPKASCRDGREPGSKLTYWAPKLARNVNRDARNLADLKAMGWRVLVIWECEALKGGTALAARVARFLK